MKYYIEPMAHQKKSLEKSRILRNMYLAWDMGTGKTAATVNIVRRYLPPKVLVLCPKPVVEGWKKEFWDHGRLPVTVLRGKMKEKVAQLANANGIVVTNLEFLSRSVEGYEAMRKFSPHVLVIDEAHRCKSPSSQLGKRVATIARNTERNILLSGTPILNGLEDIFQQYKILEANEDKRTFGDNLGKFRERYMFDANAPKRARMVQAMGRYFPDWQPRLGAPQEVSKLIKYNTLLVKQSECLDLPPVLRKKMYCELEGDQKRAYKQMRQEFITFIEGATKLDNTRVALATQATTKAIRLQQIVNGFVKDELGQNIALKSNPKLKVLEELLLEHIKFGKVVVWACFKHNYNDIRNLCLKHKIKYAEYHGEIKHKELQKRKFIEDKSVKVMIANQQSAGTGLDGLQIAPTCIYFSRNFSLEHDSQSEKRTMRKGSEVHNKLLRIDIVMRSSIDEQVLEALEKKQNIQDVILSWKL